MSGGDFKGLLVTVTNGDLEPAHAVFGVSSGPPSNYKAVCDKKAITHTGPETKNSLVAIFTVPDSSAGNLQCV